jgi:hypothetical protein
LKFVTGTTGEQRAAMRAKQDRIVVVLRPTRSEQIAT